MIKPDMRTVWVCLTLTAPAAVFAAYPALAYEPPERGLSAAFTYSGAVIGPDDATVIENTNVSLIDYAF